MGKSTSLRRVLLNFSAISTSTGYPFLTLLLYIVRKVTYSAIICSLAIHSLIFIVIILTQVTSKKIVKPSTKKVPIKSFIYYRPKPKKVITVEKVLAPESTKKELKQAKLTPEKTVEKPATKPIERNAKNLDKLPSTPANIAPTKPIPTPKPDNEKLDSFTQLQRLRSKLNQSASKLSDNPYQSYRTPSTFNRGAKPVPHSVPVKDEDKAREKSTQKMGAGIAITKGDNGACSVTQDMHTYGLNEGSSTQFFSCGESKLDKSFREHMKKVKTKLGKD